MSWWLEPAPKIVDVEPVVGERVRLRITQKGKSGYHTEVVVVTVTDRGEVAFRGHLTSATKQVKGFKADHAIDFLPRHVLGVDRPVQQTLW